MGGLSRSAFLAKLRFTSAEMAAALSVTPAAVLSERWQSRRNMERKGKFFFTSESVTEGHPDKVCDQISDGVLDAVLKEDPTGRVACETFVTRGMVIVGGEITTKAFVDVDQLVRDVVRDIGYNHPKFGFDATSCGVMNAIGRQSPDIAQGVDTGGAGDQGIMFGYACRETPELMPLPIMLAHKLTRRLSEARRKNELPYLGPDGKSQVTVEYLDGRPLRVDAVVLSTQHTEEILDKTGDQITEKAKQEILDVIIKPVLGKRLMDAKTKVFINPTGKFVIGGPASDTGVTGRKIIVDTYGGYAPHGGGAFSGKDPTKVDRSACYMARYIPRTSSRRASPRSARCSSRTRSASLSPSASTSTRTAPAWWTRPASRPPSASCSSSRPRASSRP